MFTLLSLVLTFALLSFGAVLSHTWLLIEIIWLVSAGVMLVVDFYRTRAVAFPLAVFVATFGFIALTMEPRLAVGLMVAPWAYLATSRSYSSVVRFLNVLLVIGLLEALLGLVQYFLLPGWILGYQNINALSTGTLINRNHFAGLLEMLIPLAFGLAYSSIYRFGEPARAYLYLLFGAVMGLALLFSLSRMGIFSLLSTIVFLVGVLQSRKYQRRSGAVLGFGLLALVLGGGLWIGIDGIVQRYSQLVGEEAIVKEGRLLVYRDALRMIAATPGGVGSGNFQDRFRRYQTFRPDLSVDHAHNDYLETAAEWGIPIASAFWSFLIFVVIRNVRLFVTISSPEQRGVLLASAGAIFSILVHSLADFNLQIPSNAMLFFSFVGISLAFPLKSDAGDYETTN